MKPRAPSTSEVPPTPPTGLDPVPPASPPLETLPAAAEEGLRERNKRDKLERIKAAGRALFAEKGFEATTTREIAQRAGVASGTVFVYFREKQDLFIELFREGIEAAQAEAFATLPREAPFVDQLMHLFGRFFGFYALNPALARVYVKETPYLTGGPREALDRLNQAFFVKLGELMGEAMARGELGDHFDPQLAVYSCFGSYYLALMAWLTGAVPDHTAGLAMLRASLELLVRGMGPAPDRRTGGRGFGGGPAST